METKNSNSRKLFLKGAVVVLTAICMLIPVLMVNGVVEERENMSDKVKKEILLIRTVWRLPAMWPWRCAKGLFMRFLYTALN